ncbi:phosphogluconate dehydrogenase C-terminal domain-containing protein [Frigidibacter sp. ROC022]|uniref:phosphogluconate dehydrogenase C-terminal domain-containing protein n=1 Tax=Frigidibacter sp. ROC022 TaxID=2971796 RepID=UPI00215A5186|nr:phosphogluconate dehydrogenase C-terminal domain-containing protein [Frigidibacter sp. ROC022]MCR8722770.1 NAD(P)-binding domain-containing protein [Frigidibacter sp. ROC022]
MTNIALFGAGGKMGYRLALNLQGTRFEVDHVEINPAGIDRLKTNLGIETVPSSEALSRAEVVILAVPDTHIGQVMGQIHESLPAGTMVVALDAAAPFAGHLPDRPDLTYFVTHPCHPPIFNDETELEAKRDFFGGLKARQHIVSALMQGPEEDYAKGEEIAKVIWAPVMRSHRVTVEQMALLEPGLSETVCASLLVAMREAMDEVVRRGVNEVTARDFLLGHMNVLASVIFEETPGVFSDACNKAIEFGKPALMRDDWKRVFEPQEIADSIRRIT